MNLKVSCLLKISYLPSEISPTRISIFGNHLGRIDGVVLQVDVMRSQCIIADLVSVSLPTLSVYHCRFWYSAVPNDAYGTEVCSRSPIRNAHQVIWFNGGCNSQYPSLSMELKDIFHLPNTAT